MKNIKKMLCAGMLIALSIIETVTFVACGNDEKEQIIPANKSSYISKFSNEDIYKLSKDDLFQYILDVSEETGVDIIELSQSQEISNFDSLYISECFMEKIKNNEISNVLWDTMLERTYRLKIAIHQEDFVTANKLSIWFSNLFECRDGNDIINERYVENARMAMATMNGIVDKYPRFVSLYENEQQLVLTLACIWCDKLKPNNKFKLAPIDCQNWYDREITTIIIGWRLSTYACSGFMLHWVVIACYAAESALALYQMHQADITYNSCMVAAR